MNMNKLIDEVKKKIGLVGHLSSVISDPGLRDIIYMSLEEFNRVSSTQIAIPIRRFLTSISGFNVPIYDISGNPARIEVEVAPELTKVLDESGVQIKQIHMHRIPNFIYTPQTTSMKEDLLFIEGGQNKANNSTRPAIRCKYPNILIIENYVPNLTYYQAYEMILQVTHPKTLATITVGLERWFEELCRKNIELVLYNNDLRFLNIDIGSIRVELNIDNFQNAASEKDALLDKMRTRAEADDCWIAY